MKIKQIYQTVAEYVRAIAELIEDSCNRNMGINPDTYENRKRKDLGTVLVPIEVEKEDLWMYQSGLERRLGEQ